MNYEIPGARDCYKNDTKSTADGCDLIITCFASWMITAPLYL